MGSGAPAASGPAKAEAPKAAAKVEAKPVEVEDEVDMGGMDDLFGGF